MDKTTTEMIDILEDVLSRSSPDPIFGETIKSNLKHG